MATPMEPVSQPATRKAYGRPSTPVPTMDTIILPSVWAHVAVPFRLPLPSLPSKFKRGVFDPSFAVPFSLLSFSIAVSIAQRCVGASNSVGLTVGKSDIEFIPKFLLIGNLHSIIKHVFGPSTATIES